MNLTDMIRQGSGGFEMTEIRDEEKILQVAVDIGGTFTDLVLLNRKDGSVRVTKVPSTRPDYSKGVIEALEEVGADLSDTRLFLHGTTTPLNALLERQGARTALIATQGFADVYKMGRGNRRLMYDLHYQNPVPLVPRRLIFELDERMGADGRVIRPFSHTSAEKVVKALQEANVESVAICLLHSYINPAHEREMTEILRSHASEIRAYPSFQICQEWREYERTSTASMNAYVSPVVGEYVRKLQDELLDRGYRGPLFLMQSNGGLIEAAQADGQGVNLLMSGPVGGNVASYALSQETGEPNVICVDMGGTSFDFSQISQGVPTVSSEKLLDGLPVLVPMVDIRTIGAGGGSIAWAEQGALRVGPQSAGATPGPACYGRGGEAPTLTDANLVLGRIDATAFLGGKMPLYPDLARAAVGRLAHIFGLPLERMAEGIVQVANSQMANAIRSITIGRGIDPREYVLVAFGGAGPVHAAFIASDLGIIRVIIPKAAGAFCAWGMMQANVRHDAVQTVMTAVESIESALVQSHFAVLEQRLAELMRKEGIPYARMRFRHSVDMRYSGQEYFINVSLKAKQEGSEELREAFHKQYETSYGHRNLSGKVEIVNVRVEGWGLLNARTACSGEFRTSLPDASADPTAVVNVRARQAIFDSVPRPTRFISRAEIKSEMVLSGPAVVTEQSCTTVVPPGWTFGADTYGNLVLEQEELT